MFGPASTSVPPSTTTLWRYVMARRSVRRGARGARSNRSRRPGRKGQNGIIEIFTQPEQHIVWRVLGFIIRARAELVMITVIVTAWLWTRAMLAPATPEQPVMTDPGATEPAAASAV